MKKLFILFLFLSSIILAQTISVAGNLKMENIPSIPEDIQQRSHQYRNIRSATFFGWNSMGNKLLALTRFGETNQIVQIEKPLGQGNQITFYEEPIYSAIYTKDPSMNGFLFSKDVGGSELYQVFYYDFNNGETTLLTDGNSRNVLGPISNDGEHFAFSSNRGNGKDMNIYIGSLGNYESKLLFSAEGYWIPLDWSPGNKRLLVAKYVSNFESYIYIVDTINGEIHEVIPKSGLNSYAGAAFSRDGKGIYYISDQDSENLNLRYYSFKEKSSKILTGSIPWDIESFTLSENNKYIAFNANEGGISKLYIRKTKGFKSVKIPKIPTGIISNISFNPDNNRIAFTLRSSNGPSDVFVLNISGKKLTRWTKSETGGLNPDIFKVPELISFKSFDDTEIPAFYYRPDGDGPFPLVIYIHGGPESQHRPVFRSTIQYWVNELGIAVIAPNVRGSSGYGKTYQSLDNGFKREDAVKDIGSLLDFVETMDELDQERIAVYGGSYGGYMVLASMMHYNNRLAAGIDRVGISNFVTFLKSTKSYRRDLRRMEYGDERHPEMKTFLESISPLNNASKITKPLFIVQGKNDPRVPVTEAEQMRDIVRQNGGEVWYMLATDEGHGFKKKFNRDWDMNASNLFLEKFLLNLDE